MESLRESPASKGDVFFFFFLGNLPSSDRMIFLDPHRRRRKRLTELQDRGRILAEEQLGTGEGKNPPPLPVKSPPSAAGEYEFYGSAKQISIPNNLAL